jgi:hypothetical protein
LVSWCSKTPSTAELLRDEHDPFIVDGRAIQSRWATAAAMVVVAAVAVAAVATAVMTRAGRVSVG